MTAKVSYTGGLRTSATHTRSGSSIETDAPVDNHGKGERFSPTDLVCVALATCILTTLGIAAPNHDLDIEGAACDVTKVMAADPRRIAKIVIHMTFPNGQVYTDKQKTIIEHISRTCPVIISLHPDCKKTLSFGWN